MTFSRRFWRAGIACWCVVALLLSAAHFSSRPTVEPTLAAWTDKEWVYGNAAVRVPRNCVTPGLYRSEGGGKFLGGNVLAVNLDTLASVAGIQALHNGTVSSSVPVRTPIAADTYANPLAVSALSAINASLGNGLQLGIPAGQIGAYNQWGQAKSIGQSAGAAGLVNNSGAIGLTGTAADAALPTSASLDLNTLLPGIAALANVKLNVGAIASSAVLDWCRTLENRVTNPNAPTVVTRNYGIARLDVTTVSPLVAAVRTGAVTAINTAAATVNALAASGGLIDSTLKTAVINVLNPVLGLLSLGSVTASTTLTLNVAPVVALTNQTLSDGVVTVNLSTGGLTVDLAGVLGGPNGLNNLAPNTQLVLNATVINNLTARLTTLLDNWTTLVLNTLQAQINAATIVAVVNVTVRAVVLGFTIDVATVKVTLNSTLGAVLNGTAQVTAELTLLAGGLGTVLTNLLNGLITAIVGPAGQAAIIGALRAALLAPIALTVTTLGNTIRVLTAPVVTLLGTILTPLQSALSLKVNAQPDQPNPSPAPTALPDQYKVSALSIGVLNGASSVAGVWLATSWAGPNAEL